MTRYTVRYARLAAAPINPETDRPEWDRETYSPVWDRLPDGSGAVAVYDTESEAVEDAIETLTDGRRLPYTRPADVAGWGVVIDVEVDEMGRLERYAIDVTTADAE